jgi:hypothetical protein
MSFAIDFTGTLAECVHHVVGDLRKDRAKSGIHEFSRKLELEYQFHLAGIGTQGYEIPVSVKMPEGSLLQ